MPVQLALCVLCTYNDHQTPSMSITVLPSMFHDRFRALYMIIVLFFCDPLEVERLSITRLRGSLLTDVLPSDTPRGEKHHHRRSNSEVECSINTLGIRRQSSGHILR